MWYFARGTGTAAFVLLTLTLLCGIAASRGVLRPRFVVQGLHRNLTLIAVVFLAIHVTLVVVDGYVPIRLVDAIVPFRSAYRPLGVGLGAVALDLLIALTITSLLRARIGLRTWRGLHWVAYAMWPIALAHALLSGTDRGATWMIGIAAAGVIAVAAASSARLVEAMR
jgi:methionine sulfoxide reductase heme-binding subunit